MRLISRKKIEAIMEKLAGLGVDAAVFVNSEPIIDSNIAYLSGFGGMLSGALVLSRSGVFLVTTELDFDRAMNEAEVDEVIRTDERKKMRDAIRPLLSKAKKIGIVKSRLTLSMCSGLKIPKYRQLDIGKIMEEARSIKEENEMEAIEKSAEISNKGVKFLQDFLKKGVAENVVAAELERELRSAGSERTPFEIIVSSGPGSAIIHPCPSSGVKKIGDGLVIVDFGAVYHGYVTDVTVPFLIGNVSKGEEKIAETVLSAYDKILPKIRDGVKVADIKGVYEKKLKIAGFQVKHAVGHGIGLDTHEGPSLGNPNEKLLANMTISLEPGVYVKGIGGCRLENDLIVTKTGCEVLTKSKLIRI